MTNELFKMKLKHGYGYQFVRNTLQLNLGGGIFSEIGRLAGFMLLTGVGLLCFVMLIMTDGKIFLLQTESIGELMIWIMLSF